ncbi:MAG: thioredoxin family protein [Bacteroidales bacterium]|nr:thioredoxin family protein [Bacteroidales bacterium]
MKKIILKLSVVFVFTLLLPLFLPAASPENEIEGIHFSEISWQKALQESKSEDKLIFIAFHTEWCGICKRMKRNTFSDAQPGLLFNQKFINLSLDAEKGEGKTLAEIYNVRRYPTLLFVNDEGEVIASATGFQNARRLTELGQSVLAP